MLIKELPTQKLRIRAYSLRTANTEDLREAFSWLTTKEGFDFWYRCNCRRFEEAKKLFPEYFTEDEPEVSKLIWKDATQSKPRTHKRVLLKIKDSENPVVGYWCGFGWEVCTDNVAGGAYGIVDVLQCFSDSQVTHYAEFGELPE